MWDVQTCHGWSTWWLTSGSQPRIEDPCQTASHPAETAKIRDSLFCLQEGGIPGKLNSKAPLRLALFSVPRRSSQYRWAARFNRFSWFSTKCCNWRGVDPRHPAILPRGSQKSLWDRFFFAPRRGIVCLWTEISYIWHPDATMTKQNVRGTAGDNRVNCNRIPRHSAHTAWRIRGTENRANRNRALSEVVSTFLQQAPGAPFTNMV